MISAKEISFMYRDGTVGLQPATFEVAQGELVMITGPSGSGKTTLLKLLMGMMKPSSGVLTVLGEGLIKSDFKALQSMRQQIGPVFQEFRLIEGKTAFENVLLGMRFLALTDQDMRLRARDTLIRVGLEHKLETTIEKLSWGESQRVAIARAVARGPQLILADEPTGNLDDENARGVLNLLVSFVSPTTSVVLSTHATHLIGDYPITKHLMMTRGSVTNLPFEQSISGKGQVR
jgi:cell division transport system ATP-binding protein